MRKNKSIKVFHHIADVTVGACFSECGSFRYMLEVEHEKRKGNKTVCVIMQNPSVADEQKADRSVQFIEKLVFQKDYQEFSQAGKLIVVNQFAYIQTKDFHGSDQLVGPHNDEYIREAIENSDIILIAWGKTNRYEKRKAAIKQILCQYSEKIVLKTRSHPSRGWYKDFIIPYIV